MFDAVARRYDITNTVLSLGQDRFWRRATRKALDIGPGDRVLDLAAGTAVSTEELARSGAWCVAADFSVGMLLAGNARAVPKVAADATRLPFGEGTFDAVTISFGLRNVVEPEAGLREMARVTKPGGRLVVCEFSTPTNALFGTVYKEYLMQALPRVARAVEKNVTCGPLDVALFRLRRVMTQPQHLSQLIDQERRTRLRQLADWLMQNVLVE